ncbi:MAG TPA: tetratricopeptide repeat protein [Pyrinomonadaceae bacterium]|nr:tetratricopeptide repeat protein [Pyrinomonadaceae bacterium]
MKLCPQCEKTYADDTLNFCLDDGQWLVADAEPGTALLGTPPSFEVPPSFGVPPSGGSGADAKTQLYERRETNQNPQSGTRSPQPGEPPPEGGTPNAPGDSIAVLPFTNISTDPDNEYFCDGLAEELLNALTKIEGLKVAARASTFSFKQSKTDINKIAGQLGVAHVLDGSVRKSGDRLRIAVQLVDTANGYHIWSETYDREMRDIFAVQDEITLAVIDALKLKLLGGANHAALKRHTENTEAYKAYLLGRYLRHTKNDVGGARRAFEEAVRLDPSHAPSWVGLAEGTILAAHYALIPARAACENAKKALATATSLAGESAEGRYVEGLMAYVEADWRFSEQAFRRAIGINPDQVHALGAFALTLSVEGRFDEARPFYDRARFADPLAAFPYAISGAGLVLEGRFEESLPFYEQAFTFEKENTLALWGYSIAMVSLGNFPQGLAAAEEAVRVSRGAAFFLGLLGWCLAKAGRPDEAREKLAELQARPADAPTAASEAWLLSELGDIDSAFAVLSRAVEERQAFAYYAGLPTLDRLRDDPRFSELMQSAGLSIRTDQ